MPTKKDYLKIWEECKTRDISYFKKLMLDNFGYLHDEDHMNEIGLHLQIVIKNSKPLYLHGFVLTSALHQYITETGYDSYTILETGTARGFSSICMATILDKLKKNGNIITIDKLSHTKSGIFQCIDTVDGPKSRIEILKPWEKFMKYIDFKCGDSNDILNNLKLDRIHFAFLDGHHEYNYVKYELEFVCKYQCSGDVIVCDDYTKNKFPGICKAIDEFLNNGLYESKIFYGTDGVIQRGYVYMKKK